MYTLLHVLIVLIYWVGLDQINYDVHDDKLQYKLASIGKIMIVLMLPL